LNWIYSVVLGVVQGLTEFLPVSSSGHLVLFQQLFGFEEPELFLDTCLHIGTLLAIIVVFAKEIGILCRAFIRFIQEMIQNPRVVPAFQKDPQMRLVFFIVLGSIPTAIIGVLFNRIADNIFSSIFLVGLMLLITGVFLWISRYVSGSGRGVAQMKASDALLIGCIQGLAILPGISRSGTTISLAILLGVERQLAGRYSFLLSIPAIIGALLLTGRSALLQSTSIPWASILLGTLVAFVVGYVALRVLLYMIKQGRLYRFAPYCWVVGIAAIAMSNFF
jgi:undecaprenyl-diphosphatase